MIKCTSAYYDENRKEVVVCGLDEFHVLERERESHYALDPNGKPTHIWSISNVPSPR